MLARFAVTSTQGPSEAVVVAGAAAAVDGTVADPGLVVPAAAVVSVVSVVSVVVPGDVSRTSGWESPPHAAVDRPSTTTIGSDAVLHRASLTRRIVEENEVCLRDSSLSVRSPRQERRRLVAQ
jgi:hypothetical protein